MVEGRTASRDVFEETLEIPWLSSRSKPSLAYQTFQDSVRSLIGQSSLPYSPISTTAVSVRGGERTVNCTDFPALMSTTVEFCTNPFSGFNIKYGINADISESAAIVIAWNSPPIHTSGVIVTSPSTTVESTFSPKQPLKGARQNNKARNPAIIGRCMLVRRCNPFSMLLLIEKSRNQRFDNLLSLIIT